jgi:hypothetical protein
MLAGARSRSGAGAELEFAHGDVRTFRVAQSFDAVISLFHVVSYQTGQDDLESMFGTARAHLRDGGLFLFDVWYGPAVLTMRPERRVRTYEDERVAVTRTAEPNLDVNENTVDVVFDVDVREKASGLTENIRETHKMRYFFIPELRAVLARAGLKLTHGEEWLTAREPGADTWSVCFTALAV